jgi:hypothetical protein
LNLNRPDFSRRSLKPVKARGKICADELRPSRQPTNAYVVGFKGDASQFLHARYIDHRSSHRPLSEGREEVSAPRQNLAAMSS